MLNDATGSPLATDLTSAVADMPWPSNGPQNQTARLLPYLDRRLNPPRRPKTTFRLAYRFRPLKAFLIWRAGQLRVCRRRSRRSREMVPIERITVINPRVRNKKIFKQITSSTPNLV
jgi:hypothetical protein